MNNVTFRSEEVVEALTITGSIFLILDTNNSKPHVNFDVNIYDDRNATNMNLINVFIYRNINPSNIGSTVKTFTSDDNNLIIPAMEFFKNSLFTPDSDQLWCEFSASKRTRYAREFSLKLKNNDKYGIKIVGQGLKNPINIGIGLNWTEEA